MRRLLILSAVTAMAAVAPAGAALAAPPEMFQLSDSGSEPGFVHCGTNQFTEALVGFRFIGTSPGEGLVLQDVGRIVYSGADEEEIVFLAGQHHVPDGPEAEEVFCAALA